MEIKDIFNKSLKWNEVARGGGDAITPQGQFKFVNEELKELVEVCEADSSNLHEWLTQLLLEASDVIFTLTYYELLCKHYKTEREYTLAEFLSEMGEGDLKYLPLFEAYDLVVKSNFSKFIDKDDKETLDKSLEKWQNIGTSVRVEDRGQYYVLVREEDNKVMKPTCFKKADEEVRELVEDFLKSV